MGAAENYFGAARGSFPGVSGRGGVIFTAFCFVGFLYSPFLVAGAAESKKIKTAPAPTAVAPADALLRQIVVRPRADEAVAGKTVICTLVAPRVLAPFLKTAAGELVLTDDLNRVLVRQNLAKGTLAARVNSVKERAATKTAAGTKRRGDKHEQKKHRSGKDDGKLHRPLPPVPVERTTSLSRRVTFRLFLRGADGRETAAEATLPLRGNASRTGASDEWRGWVTLLQTSPALPPADEKNRAVFRRRLERGGVRGGMTYAPLRKRRTEPLFPGAPFFVENIAGDLLSVYHALPGLWAETLAAYLKHPDDPATLVRRPSFASTEFDELFAARLQAAAKKYGDDRPLFYSAAASPSPTRLGAAFDFDFHSASISTFRLWLERKVYGTLDGLNAAWGTRFEKWAVVLPLKTEAARRRLRKALAAGGLFEVEKTAARLPSPGRRLNLAAWLDFRTFQDRLFAETFSAGRDVLNRAVPGARLGFTGGAGVFAFGWDWSLLADAVDVTETANIGCARELWRDLAPGKPALLWLRTRTPLPGETPAVVARKQRAALWAAALEGGPRGVLLWDAPTAGVADPVETLKRLGIRTKDRRRRKKKRREKKSLPLLFDAGGRPTPAAAAFTNDLRVLAGVTGDIPARGRRQRGPVALLYSPASVRLTWLVEADHLHGDKWPLAWSADTARERRESPQLRLRVSVSKLFADLGLNATWISSRMLEEGALLRERRTTPSGKTIPAFSLLFLPRVIALSDKEAAAVREFVAGGGTVVADACCGRFDEHGRWRARPALDDLFGVDSRRERLWPEVPRALERIVFRSGPSGSPRLGVSVLRALPPPFSRRLFRQRGNRGGEGDEGDVPAVVEEEIYEYGGAPVLVSRRVGRGRAVFLNLDLTDYLRDRLHPERRRAAALRRALLTLTAKQAQRDDPLFAWRECRLPVGTEIVRLEMPERTAAGITRFSGRRMLVALRRNPQERLWELGKAGDNNAAFSRAEPFRLTLRRPAWVTTLPTTLPTAAAASKEEGARKPFAAAPATDLRQTRVLDGLLDPARPALFLLDFVSRDVPTRPKVAVKKRVRPGGTAEIRAGGGGASKGEWGIWRVEVRDAAGRRRPEYAGEINGTGGDVVYRFYTALNDPPGRWRIGVRDLLTGLETAAEFRVETPGKKNTAGEAE